jgi:hypothetical protein
VRGLAQAQQELRFRDEVEPARDAARQLPAWFSRVSRQRAAPSGTGRTVGLGAPLRADDGVGEDGQRDRARQEL